MSGFEREMIVSDATISERIRIDHEIMGFRQHVIDTRDVTEAARALAVIDELQQWLRLGLHFSPREAA